MSIRLPGKVLMPAVGKPMLQLMIERLQRASTLDDIVIATTNNDTDNPVADLAKKLKVGCHRGSEFDVLQRVLDAARANDVDVIVEIPGDCPLIDARYVDACVEIYRAGDADYVSSALSQSFPHGTETQVFTTDTLADVASRTDDPADHEHVSLFIYQNPQIYRIESVEAPAEVARPDVHLTLDEPADYELICGIFEALYPADPAFGLEQILGYFDARPELASINAHVSRTRV